MIKRTTNNQGFVWRIVSRTSSGTFDSPLLSLYMKLMWHGEEIDLPDIGHEDARKLQELIALNKQDEVEALLTKLRVIDSKDAV